MTATEEKTVTIEIVPFDDDRWWYDMRDGKYSITPHEPLKTQEDALESAKKAAREFGYRIKKVEIIG